MATIKITMLFIGSIIGAGFATGTEIITFFGKINLPTWIIAGLVGIAMWLLISVMIFFNDKPQKLKSKKISVLLYFVLFTTMTAGVTQIAGIWVSILALIFSGIMVLFGFEQMSKLNAVIVIAIIMALIKLCFPVITLPTNLGTTASNLPQGILWALLYAGLNCFMLPELIKAARQKHSAKQLYRAGLITAFIIAILVNLILNTIIGAHQQQAPLPLLAVSNSPFTMIIILLAMLTSQYSSLFAIICRLHPQPNTNKTATTKIVIITTILAFGGSFFGFNQILNFAYPLIGAFTCVFWLFSSLIWWFSYHRQPHQPDHP